MRSRAPVIALAVAALAVAGCGSSDNGGDAGDSGKGSGVNTAADTAPQASSQSQAGKAATVGVGLEEWKVGPSLTGVKAGRVTFRVANDGKTTHEMVVLRTDKPASGLGKGRRVSEAGRLGAVTGLKPGASGTTTLDLKPGHYALICNLPGHYAAGMHADLTVR